ncbi:MAG TPA: glycosyltransferase [Gemmatimonadales bacterium]|nr:glycosyltransferase [Gemmatimonadales bacterium]
MPRPPRDTHDGPRVLAWPGLGARTKNPYTWLLYSQLASLGVRVEEFTVARALRGGYDVFHVHWPDKALTAGPWVVSAAGAAAALACLDAAHRHGARVVWTAHNAHPHESRHPRLERWFWGAFVRRVDAVVHPSVAGQEAVEARYPALAARPHAVVPLGHYRGSYPDAVSREEARASLDIPPGTRVMTYFGLLRPYKNVPQLIRTAGELFARTGDVTLLVVGAPLTSTIAEEVRAAAGGDPRVRLVLEHVPEIDVQRYLRAADLVVLPFREITNSGSALLALSFDRPVLVPSRGAMGELQAIAGHDWVRTYEGDLTPQILATALDWATHRVPDASPRLDALEWPEIARQTLALYLAPS